MIENVDTGQKPIWEDPKVRPLRLSGPVWNWFGLTYSAYLVLPRALMCGMSIDWQNRMVALLEEMREVYDTEHINERYVVHLQKERGSKWRRDPLANYRHPGHLPYRTEPEDAFGALTPFERWLWPIAEFAQWHRWRGRRFWTWLVKRLERRRYPAVTAALDAARAPSSTTKEISP